ncbi:MAG: hypothetical protein CMJ51_04735 [Planctomycetaceae bacterium]|nr:hypothetical protein [Planctomycetaceae bacterium]
MGRVVHRPIESVLPGTVLAAAFAAATTILGCHPVGDASSTRSNPADTFSVATKPGAASAPVLRREIPVPRSIIGPDSENPSSELSIDAGDEADLDSLAGLLLDLRIAPLTPAPFIKHPDGGTPRAIVRAYVRGRTAMADGDAFRAVEILETAVRQGGGPKVLSTLSDALELAGRSADALAIRREIARRGWLESEDARVLVEALRRRGLTADAIAIAAARVQVESDRIERLHVAVALMLALDASDRSATATMIRHAILSESPGELDAFATREPRLASLLWKLSGDDAARDGDALLADRRWRRARGLSSESAGWSERLAWSAATLGRDEIVQDLILEATIRPGAISIDQIRLFREEGVDLSQVAETLADRLRADPDRSEAARLLTVCDPSLAARTFATIAGEGRGESIAGPLVAASVPGGVEATWDVARSFGRDPDLVDVVVERLLAGPWRTEELLATILDRVEPSSTDGIDASSAVVAAEVLRRHARPDLASRILAAAVESTSATRVARIRLAADLLDPIGVDEVGGSPFDSRVETERVVGLLAAGEPELALQRVDEALLEASDEPMLIAARGRVLGTLRGQAGSGLAELRRAWRMGDRRPETLIEIIMLFSQVPVDDREDSKELDRLPRAVLEEPSFRRLLEADQALSGGDPVEAEKVVMPLLENADWRSVAIPRLLAAWRASGRLADGQARLTRQVADHPSDPVLGDALFVLDRVMNGPRSTAATLRAAMDSSSSGLPARRLELVLAEIPEAKQERLELAARRIDRSGSGAVGSLDRIELALLASDSADSKTLALLESLEPADLTPRLRRRFVSLAAAVQAPPGRDAVTRIAKWHRKGGIPVDVDTALAIVHGLGPELGAEALEGLPAAAPITNQDPSWRDRLLADDATASVRLEAIAAVLAFAVDALDPTQVSSDIVRSAVVVAIEAGAPGDRIEALLRRAADRGWNLRSAWQLAPGSEFESGVPFLEVASEASILGADAVSIVLLEAAVDQNPENPIALNNLGFALLETERIEEATSLIEQAFELDSGNASTVDSLGWMRYLEGRNDADDPRNALFWIERSIRIRKMNGIRISPEVLMHRGDAAWRTGRTAEAISSWRSITAEDEPGLRAQRLRAFDAYQRSAWGTLLISSERLDSLVPWAEGARIRLDAVAAGEIPPVFPTLEERVNPESSVQTEPD